MQNFSVIFSIVSLSIRLQELMKNFNNFENFEKSLIDFNKFSLSVFTYVYSVISNKLSNLFSNSIPSPSQKLFISVITSLIFSGSYKYRSNNSFNSSISLCYSSSSSSSLSTTYEFSSQIIFSLYLSISNSYQLPLINYFF